MPIAQIDHLTISGTGVPPFSVRGVTQTLDPIVQSSRPRRTINGVLRSAASPRFRKYASVITCSDQQHPAFDETWPGRELVVDCAVMLGVEGTHEPPTEIPTEPASEGEHPFGRLHVPGSVLHESGFTWYRPRLLMGVISWNINRDPWGAVVDWSLVLEEV